MSYTNPLLVELVVPKSVENDARIREFYQAIGWNVRSDSESEGYLYISPPVPGHQAPLIVYGQNPDPADTVFFTSQPQQLPSQYAKTK